MSGFAIKERHRKLLGYGFASVLIVFLAQAISMNQMLTQFVPPLVWQMTTGTALLALLFSQWALFFLKLKDTPSLFDGIINFINILD